MMKTYDEATFNGTIIIISHRYNHFQSLYFLYDVWARQVYRSPNFNLSNSALSNKESQSSQVDIILPHNHNYAICSENERGLKRRHELDEEHNYAKPASYSHKKGG